ncbi:MAG: T9SS type A sorting domain-containing protein, partial [Cytophagaceae bacterium]|nr:T9SS type A sorting domain-containing protein [Cytophagaceae bacterium]
VSETKIAVKANMQLSFWKYSLDNLGQYTSVDLLFQSGKRLSSLSAYTDNNGNVMSPDVARGTIGSWQNYTCQIGVGELIGDVVVGIIIGYDHASTSGTYTAYFDDIIIEDAQAPIPTSLISEIYHSVNAYPNPVKREGWITIQLENPKGGNCQIQLYNNVGQPVSHDIIDIAAGIEVCQFSLHGIPAGYYQLEIIGNDGVRRVSKIIIQDIK